MQAEMQTNMSQRTESPQTEAGYGNTSGHDLQTFSVGYKKPPVHNRFKKGCSGNPNGRPRKQGAAPTQRNEKTVEDVLLEEGQRLVSIREGDKVIKLSALQAAVRGLGVAAIKGDRRAQLAFKEIIETVEQRKQARGSALFKSSIEYKSRWEAEFKRCQALGLTPPDPLPHPDDIKLEVGAGEVNFVGPMDETQRAGWNNLQALKRNILKQMPVERRLARRRPDLREDLENNQLAGQQLIDVIDFCCPDEATRRHPLYKKDFGNLPNISKLIKYAAPPLRAQMAAIYPTHLIKKIR